MTPDATLTPYRDLIPIDTAGSEYPVYAIVRAGARQEKVSVGDVLIIDKVEAPVGESVELATLLLVDGESITTGAAELAKITVTAEVFQPEMGPNIIIHNNNNTTGYKKRQGHRQPLTQVKITAINA